MNDAQFRKLLAACERALRLYDQLTKNPDEAAAKSLDMVSSRLNDIFSEMDSRALDLAASGKRADAISKIEDKIAVGLDQLKANNFSLDAPPGGFTTTVEPLPPSGSTTPQTTTISAKGSGTGQTDSLHPDAADMIPMDEFFETVSTSLMKAQATLNDHSLEYISTLDPRFPPTLYGIPSVRAEMRVGFNNMSGTGVNLVLFSKNSQKQEYGESTLSFEVVGTPPPPGPAAYGNYVVPVPRFLVVGDKRAEILAYVRDDKKLTQTVYANTQDSALVLRYERAGEESPPKYLIMWPAQKDSDKFDYWHTMAVIYAVERRGAAGELRLDYPKEKETTETQGAESIYEFPEEVNNDVFTLNPDGLGKLASFATLKAITDNARLARLAINLGDVLMNVNIVLNQWLRAVEYKPPTPPADGPNKG
jgi:hypothetical protein